jgi:Zn-dependent M28 family amino/carboxypeptidase
MYRLCFRRFWLLACLPGLLLSGAGLASGAGQPSGRPDGPFLTPPVRQAMEAVRADSIRAHVRYLADDLLEGRDTGSPGGQKAAEYLASELKKLHLQPAGTHSTYFQQIPLVRTRMDFDRSRLALAGPAREDALLEFGKEFLLNGQSQCAARLDAPAVFAGYGITAPEFNYDDYKDLDVKGKVVVILAGEPVSNDPTFFNGDKDTPHAGGGSKIPRARARGAAAIVTLLPEKRASRFPWERARAAQMQPDVSLPDDAVDDFPALIVRENGAGKLFSGAAHTWKEVQRQAEAGDVKPFPLAQRVRLELAVLRSPLPAPNVLALLEGSDPVLKKQGVVYTAHYDHVGRREPRPGVENDDTIYNGAWDNASGTAGVLEVARAFTTLQPRPRRSILFLWVTGEERGLLGSRYYVRNPVIPIKETAANINLDMTEIFGMPKEFVPLGAERSTLQRSCEVVARELGMKIGPDPTPEENVYFRSDQFSFARVGVPSMFLRFANEYEDLDQATARARQREKLRTTYHRVTDEFDPTWSWEGMRRHTQIAFLLGLHVANQEKMPSWNEGDPFNRPRGLPVPDGARLN